MSYKNRKRSAYINEKGLWVSCDGSTIRDRKPNLKLCSNHFRYQQIIKDISQKPKPKTINKRRGS